MIRILFLGDTHGSTRAIGDAFLYAHDQRCDLIIQLGDFGWGWYFNPETGRDSFTVGVSKHVEKSGIPLWWLGGNHENYDALYELVDEKSTDKFEIEPGVFYLGRGHSFELDGVKFLTCGGAASVDKAHRREHVSWWSQEETTQADIEKCKAAGNDFDVLLTHDFPWEVGVVDRHLDPWWGPEANQATERCRRNISEITMNSGASYQWHGHLHLRYSEMIEVPTTSLPYSRCVFVRGLANPDGAPLRDSVYVFDTEQFRTMKEEQE